MNIDICVDIRTAGRWVATYSREDLSIAPILGGLTKIARICLLHFQGRQVIAPRRVFTKVKTRHSGKYRMTKKSGRI